MIEKVLLFALRDPAKPELLINEFSQTRIPVTHLLQFRSSCPELTKKATNYLPIGKPSFNLPWALANKGKASCQQLVDGLFVAEKGLFVSVVVLRHQHVVGSPCSLPLRGSSMLLLHNWRPILCGTQVP